MMFKKLIFVVIFLLLSLPVLAQSDLDLTGPQFLPNARYQSKQLQFIFFMPMVAIEFQKLALFEIYYAGVDIMECKTEVIQYAIGAFGVTHAEAQTGMGQLLYQLFRLAKTTGWYGCEKFYELRQQQVPVEIAWHIIETYSEKRWGPPMVRGDEICFKNPFILCGNKGQEDLYLWVKMQEQKKVKLPSVKSRSTRISKGYGIFKSGDTWTVVTPGGHVYTGLNRLRVKDGGYCFYNPKTGRYIFVGSE